MDSTQGRATIPEFFRNKDVLVTGATGFMGKVLVEKLLRSCPDVGKIYILARKKPEGKGSSRLDEIVNLPLFDRLKSERPEAVKKLVQVDGDVSKSRLGLSDESWTILAQNVSVVFHSAATVKFTSPLKEATLINTKGTLEMMKLCEEMKKLEVFVYVGTSFCYLENTCIEEKVYPMRYNYNDVIHCVEWMDDEMLEALTPKLIGKIPVPYPFTKSLAEQVVNEYRGQFPIVIFRPPVVTPSLSEPFPGWVESLNGPTAPMIMIGNGLTRVLHGDSGIDDYIPVDLSINCMIAAAWAVGTNKQSPDLMVVNSCPKTMRKFTFERMSEVVSRATRKYPFHLLVWYPGVLVTKNRATYEALNMILHFIPAMFMDAFLFITGQKTRVMKIQKLMYETCEKIHYYGEGNWDFQNDNYRRLQGEVLPRDREAFNFSMKGVDEDDYWMNGVHGIKRFVMGEPDRKLAHSRLHAKIMYYLDIGARALAKILFYVLLLFAFKICSVPIYNWLHSELNFVTELFHAPLSRIATKIEARL